MRMLLVLLVLLSVHSVCAYDPDDDDFDDFDAAQMWCSHRGYMGNGPSYVCPSKSAKIHLVNAQSAEHNINRSLVLEFEVQLHSINSDCDGGQTVLVECDQDTALTSTPFKQWIVPDSGSFHLILNYRARSTMLSKWIPCSDAHRHVYRLVVHSNDKYQLLEDSQERLNGDVASWTVLERKPIVDPTSLVQEILYQTLPLVKSDELSRASNGSSSSWIIWITIIIIAIIFGIVSFIAFRRFNMNRPSTNGTGSTYLYSALLKREEDDDELLEVLVSNNETSTERHPLIPYRRFAQSTNNDTNAGKVEDRIEVQDFVDNLNDTDLYQLIESELHRAGQFRRIFPSTKARDYLAYFDFPIYNPRMINLDERYHYRPDERIARMLVHLLSLLAAEDTLQKLKDIVDDLNDDDLYQLIDWEDELHRGGQFRRIFPSTMARDYLAYFDFPYYYNLLLINSGERYPRDKCIREHLLSMPAAGDSLLKLKTRMEENNEKQLNAMR